MAQPKEGQAKSKVSWLQINALMRMLSNRIRNDETFNNIEQIYAIPRGGYTPAVILSHELDVPMVGEISDNTLVVDDIADTGDTLKGTNLDDHDDVYTTTVFKRYNSEFEPDFIAQEITTDDWLVFPWEKLTDSIIQ